MTAKENKTCINFNKLEAAEDLLACFTILAVDGPGAKMTPARIASVRKTLVGECTGEINFKINRGFNGCPPSGMGTTQTHNSMKINLQAGGYVAYRTMTEEEAQECQD
tara:strand:- start:509 stop:832 length:324 start_codon:yes stop_codon:yes gene_type:complete